MYRTHARSLITSIAVLGLVLALAVPARAAVAPEVRAGVTSGEVAIGGGLLMPVARQPSWEFNPNLEATVTGGSSHDLVALNGDFHYDFPRGDNTAMWVGAGPALLWQDRGSGRETDVGLNVLTGMGAKHGDVRPFAQVRGTMSNENRLAIAGGVRF
ncbi:MAG: hypothetical protein HY076_01110 [Candidatus Eisenbacteria bacterium]|uniref:Porin family protein n=1 Tax=Eiseniibacteriota bacterium TaxID=2212470 RepID=A0A9D6L761_UNCEI|nr:hypothetical protein [Candidatus Eisenbacteria bacterium]MBI3538860.1 hypothetical protein [Candidatus Eisenbacteria bacterium]